MQQFQNLDQDIKMMLPFINMMPSPSPSFFRMPSVFHADPHLTHGSNLNMMNYDQLSQFSAENKVKITLSVEQFSMLPQLIYHKDQNNNNNNKKDQKDQKDLNHQKWTRACSICLSDFEEGDHITILPCLHQFHTDEISKWLLEESTICPVCKQKVNLPV
jgi:hypothetical protein